MGKINFGFALSFLIKIVFLLFFVAILNLYPTPRFLSKDRKYISNLVLELV